MSAFRDRVVRGVAWRSFAQVGNQVMNLGVVVLLTRLLAPSAFGLVAMAGLITGFFAVFSGLGLGAALVQRPEIEDRHRTSIFWTNMGVATALAAAVALCGPVAAWFFEQPELRLILPVAGLQFPLGALTSIHRVELHRALRFDALSRVELIASLLGGAVAVALAFGGAGVWAIIARSIATAVISAALLLPLVRFRPRLRYDARAVQECLRFGLNTLGMQMFAYFSRNLDNFLVGTYLGSVALGLYTRAYAFMLMPLIAVTNVVSRVLFPAFSSIQHDHPRIRDVFLRTAGAVGLLTFPAVLGFMALAEPFVHAVLGPQWEEVVPLLFILCPVGLWQSVAALSGSLFESQGRPDLQLRVSVPGHLFVFACLLVGLQWDVIGVAVAYALASPLIAVLSCHFGFGLVGLRWAPFLRRLRGILGAAMVSGATGHLAVLGLRSATELGAWPQLVCGGLAFVATYVGLLWMGRPQPVLDLKALIEARRAQAR